MKYMNEAVLRTLLPIRARDTHKGDYGKILLLCGSRGFTGAAALAAVGALRTGAGLTYLAVPESIYAIEAVKLTEPVVLPLPDMEGKLCAESIGQIAALVPKMDAVLFGSGSGIGPGTDAVLRFLLENCTCPLILDADGITLAAGHKDILRKRSFPTVLTPHDGEFARLGPRDLPRLEQTMALARELGVVLLRKGHRTLVTDGEVCWENRTGNPGMATGGSGDVLTGVCAALTAWGAAGGGMTPMDAARCAVYVHGLAGDIAAQQIGETGMTAMDIAAALPHAFRQIAGR